MESLVTSHWQMMQGTDRQHRVKLVVDEWGAWHRSAPLADPSHLFESPSTIRDALVAGLTLDTFNRHADKVAMANVAQLVNCIQSLFFAHEDRFVVTPTYHVFALYADHQGGRSVRTVWSAPETAWTDDQGGRRTLWGLSGSASVRDGVLTLTVVNPWLQRPLEAEVVIRGGGARSGRATVLAAGSVHDVNSFERPGLVAPAAAVDVAADGPLLRYIFPPASVTRLTLPLSA